MLEFLKPVSKEHSISKVIASVFVPQSFLKPQDVLERTKTLEGFSSYQKKMELSSARVNIDNKSIDFSENQIRGFIFENYDNKGEINHIFKLNNIRDNQSVLSLETRKYTTWNSFKTQLKSDIETLSTESSFYVSAISLTYVDEFIWTNKNTPIAVEALFKKDSEFLNKKFLSSKNSTLILFSQGEYEPHDYEEKTEISFNNDIKRITINHQYVIKLKEIQLFESLNNDNTFFDLFDIPHNENKKILMNILTNECQDLINLK